MEEEDVEKVERRLEAPVLASTDCMAVWAVAVVFRHPPWLQFGDSIVHRLRPPYFSMLALRAKAMANMESLPSEIIFQICRCNKHILPSSLQIIHHH